MPAKTFEDILKTTAIKAPTGCGVLVLRDGKVLTGTRTERASRGQICGPGGHIEPGETPEEAAKREAMEEFGIECHGLRPLGVQDGGRHGTSAVFLCTDYTGTPRTDEEEMTNPKWLTIRQIRALDAFPPFLRSLELLPRDTVRKFNPYHDAAGRFSTAGGGGAGIKTDSALFARAQFKEIAGEAGKIADAARTELGISAFGLRVQEHDTETVGAPMTHRSQNFGGDFEDAHGAEYREALDGVSTIGLGRAGEVGEFGGYSGTVAYLIGGEQSGPGYDPGEDIIKEPVVLAKFGYKDGKLIVLDAIKHDQKATESEKPNRGPDASKPNKEYTNFVAQMAQKYGADEMYAKMTDSEFDKYQHLEMHRFDKSARGSTFEEVLKFNPYHGPDGRFSSAHGAHSFTYAPGKSKAHDLAIAREKERQAMASAGAGAGGQAQQADGGHKPHLKGKELVDYTMKQLGVSEQEAKDMVKEVSGYTDGYATDMRIWQQGGKQWDMQELTPKEAQRMSENVEKFIEKSPKWDGGKIYRGIGVDEDTAHRMLDDISFSGKPFDMKGTSSWTSDKDIADEFANWNGADVTVIFEAPGTKKGTSIDHISDFSQKEVLVSQDARWDVKRIDGSIDDGYLVIKMEERL